MTVRHAAKAVEETLEAIRKGKSLRDWNLEFMRRLVARKQVRDLKKILEDFVGNRECHVIVTSSPIKGAKCCNIGGIKNIEKIFPKLIVHKLGFREKEDLILSTVAMTSIGKWYK